MEFMGDALITNYDIRGTKESGLSVECAWNIGKAIADWLPSTGGVVVMYHASQSDIAKAVIEGLRLQGRAVVDGGQGDAEVAKKQITASGLSGAVVVGQDALDHATTIELYQHEGKLVGGESGLRDICILIDAGNFVPAALRGTLTHI